MCAHPLCSGRNLPRTSGTKSGGKLEAATHDEHGDHVVDRSALKEPETGRSDVYGALGIVGWVGFIAAPRSKLMSERHGVFAVIELMANPRPIAL